MEFVNEDQELWREVAAIVEDEGLRVYDIERSGAGLRVFIDTLQSEHGVTSQQCATICRRLLHFFSVEGPRLQISTTPTLEVSSPGIERLLRLPWHFEAACGSQVKVRHQLSAETVVSHGRLLEANADAVVIESVPEQERKKICRSSIVWARVKL